MSIHADAALKPGEKDILSDVLLSFPAHPRSGSVLCTPVSAEAVGLWSILETSPPREGPVGEWGALWCALVWQDLAQSHMASKWHPQASRHVLK